MHAVTLVKFLHIVLALGLTGSLIYCLCLSHAVVNIRKLLLMTGLFAGLTGTLLVPLRHYTFHTPWIQAAFVLLSVFLLLVILFVPRKNQSQKIPSRSRWLGLGVVLGMILVVIIHDAVTKTTFL